MTQPLAVMEKSPGNVWLRELYDMFAPVRAEAAVQGISEVALNETIDDAVPPVRSGPMMLTACYSMSAWKLWRR